MKPLTLRYKLACAAFLTVVAALSVGATWQLAARQPATAPTACDRLPRVAPRVQGLRVLELFITAVVQRRSPLVGYRLMTPHYRAGLPCSSFTAGNLPVQPFGLRQRLTAPSRYRIEQIDRNTAGYAVKATFSVYLATVSEGGWFVAEIRRVKGGPWLVDSWTPDVRTMPYLNPPRGECSGATAC